MSALYWLIALAVLLGIEIATMGLTTIWFAGGCLVAFVAALFSAPLWLQVLLFLAVSLAMLIFTRPVALRYLNQTREKTNYESVIGREGKVTQQIDNFNEMGTVVLAGQEWSARSLQEDRIIEPGTAVVVREIRGVKVIVEPVNT